MERGSNWGRGGEGEGVSYWLHGGGRGVPLAQFPQYLVENDGIRTNLRLLLNVRLDLDPRVNTRFVTITQVWQCLETYALTGRAGERLLYYPLRIFLGPSLRARGRGEKRNFSQFPRPSVSEFVNIVADTS